MESIDKNYPQFIKMDRERKDKYLLPIINTQSSEFYNRDQGEVYFIAACIGYANKSKVKTEKSTDIRTYHGLKDSYKLLIRIMYLDSSNYDYESLSDGTTVLKEIEEYANGGFPILHDKIFGGGSNFSLEGELWQELKALLN